MNEILITLSLCFAGVFANGLYGGYGMGAENTFLVTMRRGELMKGAVTCTANSRDHRVCNQYNKCTMMLPPQIVRALKQCRVSVTGQDWAQCNSGRPFLAPEPQREKIFDCINANARAKNPEERMAVVQSEACFRDLNANGCMHKGGYDDGYYGGYYGY